jgi:hypothetical protein
MFILKVKETSQYTGEQHHLCLPLSQIYDKLSLDLEDQIDQLDKNNSQSTEAKILAFMFFAESLH